MLEKIEKHNIDLSILVVDMLYNKYKAEPFKGHIDYDSFKLVFTFEDRTDILNDGKDHMMIVAEYVNADDQILIKLQDEDFDRLLSKLENWCNKHKIQ